MRRPHNPLMPIALGRALESLLPAVPGMARPVMICMAFTLLPAPYALAITPSDEGADGVLPEVVVTGKRVEEPEGYAATRSSTATRTDTPLVNVPQSVTVVTEAQIKDQSAQSIADVMRYVPGVGMAQGEGNRETPILRGNSTTSDFFLNGVRDDVQYYRDLYNIDRVEVLKGPNAMIFGRGGVGGVINRVTRRANWSPVREITLQGGSYDNKRTTIDVGQGLNDTVAARVTAVYEDSESYRDGVSLKRQGVNPTLAFNLGDSTQLIVGYEYFKDERVADRGVPSIGVPAGQKTRPYPSDPSAFFGDPARSPTDTELNVLTLDLEHDFSPSLLLRNRTLFGNYDKFYQNVYASSAVNSSGTYSAQAYNNDTQRRNLFNQTDLVWKLESGPLKHTVLTGIEVGQQETENRRLTGYFPGNASTYSGIPASNPTIDVPVTWRSNGTSDANNEGTIDVAAVYVQDQIEFSPQFQAIVGLRYDQFDVDFNDRRPGPTGAGQVSTKDGLVSPRAGLIYKPSEPVSLYVSYSQSFLPRAGEQLASLSLTNKSLDPEEFENQEVGAKWEVSPALSLTAAVYQLDRTNVLLADPTSSGQTILGDGQRTRGAELGISGNLTEAWSVAGGVAYQDGELTGTASATAQKGATLAQLPQKTFSLWNRYDFTEMWGVGLGVYNRSDMYTSTDNTVVLDGYTRVDGAVYLTLNKNLRAQLNVENLLDEEYFVNAHTNNNITPGSPRAFRVGLTANF